MNEKKEMNKWQKRLMRQGFVFDTHTDVQNEFIERIKSYGTEKALQWPETVKDTEELSYPEILTFRWENDSSEYIFELSKNQDFTDSYKIIRRLPYRPYKEIFE